MDGRVKENQRREGGGKEKENRTIPSAPQQRGRVKERRTGERGQIARRGPDGKEANEEKEEICPGGRTFQKFFPEHQKQDREQKSEHISPDSGHENAARGTCRKSERRDSARIKSAGAHQASCENPYGGRARENGEAPEQEERRVVREKREKTDPDLFQHRKDDVVVRNLVEKIDA